MKAEDSAKGTEECKILGTLMAREVENLNDYTATKVNIFDQKQLTKSGFAGDTPIDKRLHFKGQRVGQNCLVKKSAIVEVVNFVL